jgi:membrane protease YdiL (CAAX protease family)
MRTKSIGQKILHFSLTKIIIGIIVVGGFVTLGQIGIGKLLNYTTIDKETINLIVGIIVAVLAIFSYTLLFRFYERRIITELSSKGIAKNLILGMFLGAILQSLTILIIYLKGGFSIISVNPFLFLLPAFIMAFTSAIFEEVLMRGIIFRIIEEKLGSYFALFISAFIFGAMHLANPNGSLTTALGLAIQAGLLLATAYIYSRNLWFPIAIHFGWNFTQSGIFGAIVSGNSLDKSLLTTKIQGAEWFTGGQFGPEGSIQATLFCLIATIVLMTLNIKQKKLINPYWKK